MKDIFTKYFNDNTWGDNESISGPGSTLEHTENIRKLLSVIFNKYNITSVLDAPCGDYNWFSSIPRTIKYIGGDIVDELIKQNKIKYENNITSFVNLDVTKDKLPDVDLMICRDCWPHFSTADIKKSIDVFLTSNIKYLMVTNCGNGPNIDIETGKFRFLNLQVTPFSFGLPLEVINEWTWTEFPPKTLVMYDRNSIHYEK